MISRISGTLQSRREDSVLLDVNGISYEVLIPGAVMNNLESQIREDGILCLITYHYLQVDQSRSIPFLIGFLNEIEKEFFEKFITVSGIGPKAACKALNIPLSRIAQAIDVGDLTLLKSLPGIGNQRAKEIVAKLQGKVGKFALMQDIGGELPASYKGKEGIQEQALEVLLQLQYKKLEAKSMIDSALSRNPDIETTEDLLNEVYKQKTKR